MRIDHLLLMLFLRSGTVNFSVGTHFQISDIVINSAILERHVPALTQVPKTLSSSTSLVLILSQSTIVIAVTSLCRRGINYSARDGSQLPFHVLKPSSRSTVLKPSTNSLFKGKQIFTTITIPSYDEQTMPTSQIQL